jgi:hypothetical protein
MSDPMIARFRGHHFRGHQLTFRMPTGYAVCLACLRTLTVDDLARPCPGPAPTEQGSRA